MEQVRGKYFLGVYRYPLASELSKTLESKIKAKERSSKI
jgi:hypothetical protein